MAGRQHGMSKQTFINDYSLDGLCHARVHDPNTGKYHICIRDSGKRGFRVGAAKSNKTDFVRL